MASFLYFLFVRKDGRFLNFWKRSYAFLLHTLQSKDQQFVCTVDGGVNHVPLVLASCRPSHLKIPGGPKMARAAICRRAIEGPSAVMAAKRPFRRAKNGPSQMRRADHVTAGHLVVEI